MARKKRAGGGSVKGEGSHPPHGHMIIMIGLGAKPKKKKKAGGNVEGKAARHHLGKRARGGAPKLASGGHANPAMGTLSQHIDPMEPIGRGGAAGDYLNQNNEDEQSRRDSDYRMDNGGFGKSADGEPKARGGRAGGSRVLDARQASNDPDQDGRDKVPQRMGTDERDVEMGDPRRHGGGVHRASGGEASDCDEREEREFGGDVGAPMSRGGYDSPATRKSGGHVKFRTPSGSVSAGARKEAEGKHEAMPGGRFPIRNTGDLSNAKHAFGRANDKPAVKRWINKRAKDLGEPPLGG